VVLFRTERFEPEEVMSHLFEGHSFELSPSAAKVAQDAFSACRASFCRKPKDIQSKRVFGKSWQSKCATSYNNRPLRAEIALGLILRVRA